MVKVIIFFTLETNHAGDSGTKLRKCHVYEKHISFLL
jgi:hypothetical protein